MDYYEAFMRSNKPANETYKEHLQELVDFQFENASTYTEDVEEEVGFGTLRFRRCPVRVNTIVDVKTGQRNSDDYKKLLFRDINYKPKLGTRYRFNNNIWIAYSLTTIKTDISSVYVRRCNNVLTIQNEYGVIHHEPCFIDYKLTETQLWKETTLDVPSARLTITCQLNDYTKNIKIGDRFIFDEDVYRVRIRNRNDRLSTFDRNSSTLLLLHVDYDELGKDDNVELNIANYRKYNYNFHGASEITVKQGESTPINYSIYLDDALTEEKYFVQFEDDEIASFNTKHNTVFGVKSGTTNMILTMINNPDITLSVPLTVTADDVVVKCVDIIQPAFNEIEHLPLNQTHTFYIYEYLGEEKQDTTYTFEIIKTDAFGNSLDAYKYCRILVDGKKDSYVGNVISIKNLRKYDDMLMIKVKNNNTNKYVVNPNYQDEDLILCFELGGLF